MVDWQVFATIAAPLIALIVGIWANRRFESRVVLLTHLGHVSSFTHRDESGGVVVVNTHTVVVRNAGRRAATNVRFSHNHLPSFNIWPRVQFELQDVPNFGQDIVVPTLVPNEQLTISYLYFPPITYPEVNARVKCDEAIATPISVLLQRQYPPWFNNTMGILVIVGASALIYGLFELFTLIAAAIFA